jgi:hypothetical protein
MDGKYTAVVRTTSLFGHVSELRVSGPLHERDYIRDAALVWAIESGWNPPRWWQWWRRNDTRLDHFRDAPLWPVEDEWP